MEIRSSGIGWSQFWLRLAIRDFSGKRNNEHWQKLSKIVYSTIISIKIDLIKLTSIRKIIISHHQFTHSFIIISHTHIKNTNNLPNNIDANNTIGITQFKSIRKPKTRFPINAPPRPNVSDKAAAITLSINIHTKWLINNLIKQLKSILRKCLFTTHTNFRMFDNKWRLFYV